MTSVTRKISGVTEKMEQRRTQKKAETIQRHLERGGQNQSGYWQDMERNKTQGYKQGGKRKELQYRNCVKEQFRDGQEGKR
eukprot:10879950-Ditylum_brightwellii.AAC.1